VWERIDTRNPVGGHIRPKLGHLARSRDSLAGKSQEGGTIVASFVQPVRIDKTHQVIRRRVGYRG